MASVAQGGGEKPWRAKGEVVWQEAWALQGCRAEARCEHTGSPRRQGGWWSGREA